MANTRHRVRDNRYGVTGVYQTFPPFPSTTVQSATAGEYKVCDDTVSGYREKRAPHALLIVTQDTFLPSFSGRYPLVGTPTKQLSGCPADYNPAPPDPTAWFPTLTTVQESSLAWESLAATNPNVAHVSLPTFWAELKDLPLLWRTWGDKQLSYASKLWKGLLSSRNKFDRLFLQRVYSSVTKSLTARDLKNLLATAPKANLWYRWGWAPLVRDIRQMFSFTQAAFQRLTWLTRLQSGNKTLKRRAMLRNSTGSASPTTVTLKSVGAFIQGRRTLVYTEKVWTAVEWKLDTSTRIAGVGLEGDPLWIKAHQLTFGLTYQDALSALWEIMPWSWFVDWFLHVQTVMDATKNTIPVTWLTINLMRHTTAKAIVEPLASSSDLTWCKPSGQHRQSGDRKQRLLVSPVLPFAPSMIPVFTTGQWSILGSLAILRSIRR